MQENKPKDAKYWASVLVITGMTVYAAAVTIYTFLKEGPIPLSKFFDIALWMGGLVSFLGFYVGFGFFSFAVIVTGRSNELSWQEKAIYWLVLLKRSWIFLPLFIFGNYVMVYHFIPGATPDLWQWLLTALVELPLFTLFVVVCILLISRFFRRPSRS